MPVMTHFFCDTKIHKFVPKCYIYHSKDYVKPEKGKSSAAMGTKEALLRQEHGIVDAATWIRSGQATQASSSTGHGRR